uniref:Uncharacterized protein n=1 Tax=viral metagenome TaxID=1070528 RepID=A0A6M3LAT0_9ZZZZ
MIKLGWTFLVLATLYFAGVCIYGAGRLHEREEKVSQASCMQYFIEAESQGKHLKWVGK